MSLLQAPALDSLLDEERLTWPEISLLEFSFPKMDRLSLMVLVKSRSLQFLVSA